MTSYYFCFFFSRLGFFFFPCIAHKEPCLHFPRMLRGLSQSSKIFLQLSLFPPMPPPMSLYPVQLQISCHLVFFLWAVGCCQRLARQRCWLLFPPYYHVWNEQLFSNVSINLWHLAFGACSRSDGKALRWGCCVAGWYISSWLILLEVDSGQCQEWQLVTA